MNTAIQTQLPLPLPLVCVCATCSCVALLINPRRFVVKTRLHLDKKLKRRCFCPVTNSKVTCCLYKGSHRFIDVITFMKCMRQRIFKCLDRIGISAVMSLCYLQIAE